MPRRSLNRWLLLVVIVATPLGLFLFRTQLAEATGRGIAEIGARVIEHQYDVELHFDHAQMRYATLELEGVGFKLRRYPSFEGFAETVRIDLFTWVVELSDGRMPVGLGQFSGRTEFKGQNSAYVRQALILNEFPKNQCECSSPADVDRDVLFSVDLVGHAWRDNTGLCRVCPKFLSAVSAVCLEIPFRCPLKDQISGGRERPAVP